MPLTPNELLSQQYNEIVEDETEKLEKEVEKEFIKVLITIYAMYRTLPKSMAYSFRLSSDANKIIASLKDKVYELLKKYESNVKRISLLKNRRMLNKMLSEPKIGGWISRKINEITINQRIAKYVEMYKKEVEARIAIGIANGESEMSLIKTVEKFLESPLDIFAGQSKANWKANRLAKEFMPGRGTYGSSFANAKRLVRSEIFETYRRMDYEIWKQSKEVVGVKVSLNPAHKITDICDDMNGMYPKDFFFPGWHPRCICLSTPITYGEMITEIPEAAKEYMSKEKHKKWYGKLNFVSYNKNYFEFE